MTEQENQNGSNEAPLKDALADDYKEVIQIDRNIKSERDAKNAIRSRCESNGIPKKAFDFGLKYLLMDQEERDAYMNALLIVCEVIGAKTEDLVSMMNAKEDEKEEVAPPEDEEPTEEPDDKTEENEPVATTDNDVATTTETTSSTEEE